MPTDIEWAEEVWNPVTGCSKVSAGCVYCYAERVDHRIRGAAGEEWKPWTAGNAKYNVRLHPERLEKPLHWRTPRRVFVNSMSDLFHGQVPDEFIDRVMAVMALTPQHTYIVLTKRPERMRDYLRGNRTQMDICNQSYSLRGDHPWPGWPLPNVILGVSAEDQATLNERLPVLLDTPATRRCLSLEPLLGHVSITEGLAVDSKGRPDWSEDDQQRPIQPGYWGGLDWVIVGGESGARAKVRPCNIEWIRSVVQQCRAAQVPVFVKQLGSKPFAKGSRSPVFPLAMRREYDWQRADAGPDEDCVIWYHPRDRKGGNPEEWAEDLRVREYPV